MAAGGCFCPRLQVASGGEAWQDNCGLSTAAVGKEEIVGDAGARAGGEAPCTRARTPRDRFAIYAAYIQWVRYRTSILITGIRTVLQQVVGTRSRKKGMQKEDTTRVVVVRGVRPGSLATRSPCGPGTWPRGRPAPPATSSVVPSGAVALPSAQVPERDAGRRCDVPAGRRHGAAGGCHARAAESCRKLRAVLAPRRHAVALRPRQPAVWDAVPSRAALPRHGSELHHERTCNPLLPLRCRHTLLR